jgi:hypothetical protein
LHLRSNPQNDLIFSKGPKSGKIYGIYEDLEVQSSNETCLYYNALQILDAVLTVRSDENVNVDFPSSVSV